MVYAGSGSGTWKQTEPGDGKKPAIKKLMLPVHPDRLFEGHSRGDVGYPEVGKGGNDLYQGLFIVGLEHGHRHVPPNEEVTAQDLDLRRELEVLPELDHLVGGLGLELVPQDKQHR